MFLTTPFNIQNVLLYSVSIAAITNYYKYRGSNNTNLLSYNSVGQESNKGLSRLKLRCHWGYETCRPVGESFPLFTEVIGRASFLAPVGVKPLLPCWLSTESFQHQSLTHSLVPLMLLISTTSPVTASS